MILKLETRPPSVVACEQVEPGALSESPTTRRARNPVVKGRYKYKPRGTSVPLQKLSSGSKFLVALAKRERTDGRDSGT